LRRREEVQRIATCYNTRILGRHEILSWNCRAHVSARACYHAL